MAKQETITCDICGAPARLEMTLFDKVVDKVVNNTDLCEIHFNLLRSYIRKGCPKVETIE